MFKLFTTLALIVGFFYSNLSAQQHFTESIYLLNADAAGIKDAVSLLNNFEGIMRVAHTPAKNPETQATIQFVYEHESNRFGAIQMLMANGFVPYNAASHIPADFPRAMGNGSKEDKILFETQKALWIQNHPERYQQLIQQNVIHIVSQSDFDQMPPEKQNHILSNPDLYQIE